MSLKFSTRLACIALVAAIAFVARARAQDEEQPKPNPFVEAVKSAVAKSKGKAFLAESKEGKVEVSVWKDKKAWIVVVDAKTNKAEDPKEPPKDSDATENGKNVAEALDKAKIELAAAVEKALQGEDKIEVNFAQALMREKALYYLVELKKAGVVSSWEVDPSGEGKPQQPKQPGQGGGM